ncbi:MAG TPA: aldehyde dehydrogenase family protein, partial [Candidatus Coatesbacteria bacterium]|nr:aldehyde dehydrogenase family protein [Candidatus Coatesbacteria bacterium]
MEPREIYVAGEWVAGEAEPIAVSNPYTDREVAQVGAASAEQVRAACRAAKRAFNEYRRWSAHRRAEAVARLRDGVRERREELAQILVRECGKPLTLARAEVERCLETLSLAAEGPRFLTGHEVPLDASPVGEGMLGLARRVPLGPIAAITPFNFPLNLTAHKLGPALAVGCTVVHKPASATPLDAFVLAEILSGLELPPGTYNLVPGRGAEVGEPLCASGELRAVSFTGSGEVGRWLAARAGLKKLTLELGSTAAAIVAADADLDFAVPRLVRGAFGFAGQSCISLQRAFVERKIFDDFRDRFVAETRTLAVGDPAREDVLVGPMISAAEADRALAWISEAKEQGAVVLTGGTREGNVVQPTVLVGVRLEMKVVEREVFAPVVSLVPYDTLDEAVAWTNRNDYGLNLSIFTKNLDAALRSAEELEAGAVLVNESPTWRADIMPYGGVKGSGMGREGTRYAFRELT